MNKYFLVFMISGGFFFTASAQSKFSIGPNAGVGVSWLGDDGEGSKSKLAGNAGLSLVYSAAEHFGIGLDAKYSFEGAKYEIGSTKSSVNLNYVRLPLKAIYFFGNYGQKLRPKVAIGPSFGFLSSAKIKSGENSVDIKDDLNSFDFGVTAAAGLNYRLVSNTWLNLDVNYLHGVSDINKPSPGINTEAAHNRNVQLNIGVNFGI